MRIRNYVTPMALSVCIVAMANGVKPAVETFPLDKVRLTDSPFKDACDLNIEVLLQYDTDRLLAPFFKEAGLPMKALPFPNWHGLDGHVAGHYLSALSMAYASTGNEACKQRADYIVGELKKVQDANGNGYIGGIPDGKPVWELVKAGNGGAVSKLWAPWYNLHKTYAGLRDAWLYTRNDEARKMFIAFCDWGMDIISNLDEKEMEKMLDTEFGGMNEVYADAYEMTGDTKYLEAAKRFSHKKLFDSMARHVDNLDNMHANTQVPKAVGYQRVAEITGDSTFATAATFFWNTVVDNRTLSFGGNSRREHFPSAQACHEYAEERQGPETCNTYNMLKLTEGLFRMNPSARYADYYERALYNHIRSSQHPTHGGYVYFTSARPRHYRVYSSLNESMWCCVGTGMENHCKYGEFIYAHSDNELYVNLFIPSVLKWEDKGLTLSQETSFPEEEQTRILLKLNKPKRFTLKIRIPSWLDTQKPGISINGKPLTDYKFGNDSYVSIHRKWKSGDCIEMDLPMRTYIEEMPNVPDFISVIHGPIVLAANTGQEYLDGLVANDSRWGHIANGRLLPLSGAPIIVGDKNEIMKKVSRLQPIDGKPLHYICPGLFGQDEYSSLELEPFAGIHDSRYAVYWQSMSRQDYDENRKRLEEEERIKLELDRMTVDKVECGEQQPETDHGMRAEKSFKGVFRDESFRGVEAGGSVSYDLSTGNAKKLKLQCHYWGAEKGNCTFDILVDGKTIATENLASKWNQQQFVNTIYEIPEETTNQKEQITVTFSPHTGNRIPGIYQIRLLKEME